MKLSRKDKRIIAQFVHDIVDERLAELGLGPQDEDEDEADEQD